MWQIVFHMPTPLKIVMIGAECVPFVKTGGLADVLGALPKALHDLGHEVKIILPKYSMIDSEKFGLKRFREGIKVWMGEGRLESCAVDVAFLENKIPVYFIENWSFFKRDGIYSDAYSDFGDNPERFAFFTRAALQLCVDAEFKTDIVHAHDWHTALAPAYLKTWPWRGTALETAASVFTIHNIQYQGVFSKNHLGYTGISWEHFTPEKFEYYDNINYLKGGISFADKVTTVSPTYAEETKNSKLGVGLNGILQHKGENYLGILNGVDYNEWNPESDELIFKNFSRSELKGKQDCKENLQNTFNFESNADSPLIGVVSRLADQKGLDVLHDALQLILPKINFQFILLGSGDKRLEARYGHLAAQYPNRVGAYLGYNNELAHKIEAGSDFFAMPSRFEPCGLNQLYSLKYGTLPIVRDTGGLADTIEQYDQASGTGTGFKFNNLTKEALAETILWALDTWYHRKDHINKMINTAMSQDFGWERSAKQYADLYRDLVKNNMH